MGILDFLSGEFIDVISWTDNTRDTIVWRFEREGHAIKYGAKLTVREGQAAVFIHEGQLADVFSPGLYMLETNNMPIMTTLNNWDHGFKSPFQSEIYFVNTTRFTDLKWGTKNPIMCRDPEFGPVRIRAFGTYEIRVSDPARFLLEVVGTDGEFTSDEITYQVRNIIVSNFSTAIARANIPVLDMAANTPELGKLIVKALEPSLAEYGLSMPSFFIENISLPPKVEEILDKRTSMGIVGDLNTYMQFQAAESMTIRGGAAGQSIGAGLGAGMGLAMAQQSLAGPWGAVPNAAPAPQAQALPQAAPPPLPQQRTERLWHIAKDGAPQGPFSKARLGRMQAEGELTRETLIWSEGLDGWTAAGEVAELAKLFTVAPPPLPET